MSYVLTQEFSKRIKEARALQGKTQTEVATLAGMDLRNYQRIEGAEVSCKILTAEKICHVLSLPTAKALA